MSVNERVRLAQELHDGIAQDLVGLGYSIDSLLGTPGTPLEIRSELRSVRFALTELVDKVRAEIFALRENPENLPSRYEASTSYELQRIFIELLRNVQEHSQATSITISLEDNGIGGTAKKEGRHGLIGIDERVRGLNGVLDIQSTNAGTSVCITVPWVNQ